MNTISNDTEKIYCIADVLEKVEARCGLYLGSKSVTALFHFLHGFQAYQNMQNENFHDKQFHEFHNYLRKACDAGVMEATWEALIRVAGGDKEGYDLFFSLWHKFNADK